MWQRWLLLAAHATGKSHWSLEDGVTSLLTWSVHSQVVLLGRISLSSILSQGEFAAASSGSSLKFRLAHGQLALWVRLGAWPQSPAGWQLGLPMCSPAEHCAVWAVLTHLRRPGSPLGVTVECPIVKAATLLPTMIDGQFGAIETGSQNSSGSFPSKMNPSFQEKRKWNSYCQETVGGTVSRWHRWSFPIRPM